MSGTHADSLQPHHFMQPQQHEQQTGGNYSIDLIILVLLNTTSSIGINIWLDIPATNVYRTRAPGHLHVHIISAFVIAVRFCQIDIVST